MPATFPVYLFLINAVAQLVESLRYKPEDRCLIPNGVIAICH